MSRRLVLSFATPALFYGLSMSVRLAFGVVTPRFFVSDAVLTLLAAVVVFSAAMRSMRWSLRRRHSLARGFAYAALVCAVFMGLTNVVRALACRFAPAIFVPDPALPDSIAFALLSGLSDSLPLVIWWSGLYMLPFALRRAERRRVQAIGARREAEVLRLRAHLEPHFLLNTLNAISGLVEDEPLEARRLIGLLGDLFRDATTETDLNAHSFGEEMAWLKRYAAIHEARHGRMVRFEWDSPPEANDVRVPRLLLQPLVENAVLHGVLRQRGGGTIRVSATVASNAGGDVLACSVEDDGAGFPEGGPRKGARGLRIVERSLRLGGGRGRLEIARREGWTCVSFELPATTVEKAGAA